MFNQAGAATNRNGAWATAQRQPVRRTPVSPSGSSIEAADASTASLVEAGVDDVRITQS